MIKRISKINNLAVFNNFDWNTSVVNKDGQAINFAKINILYGRNYSGKTTLSRIIRSLETKKRLDKYDDHHYEICNEDGTTITEQSLDSNTLDIRVFNEDFIRENLHFLIDPNSGITPFAILGSDNDRIQREIDMLTDEIGTPEGKTGLYKVLSDQKNQYNICIEEYNSVKNALDKKLASKATDRSSGIKYQSAKYGDQNYNVTKLKDEISIVASGKYSCLKPEKKSELELLLAQSPKNAIKLIETPSLNLDIYCKNAEELMTKKIEVSNKIQELLVNNALNEWVKRGTELFDGEDVCPFCGNRISDERWKEIHAHFDEETKKLTDDLEQLIRQIEIEIETVSKPLSISQEDFYPTFSADYLTATEQKDNAIKLYCKALDDVVIQLNSRIKQITQPLQFERVVYDVAQINDAFQAINNVIKKNNEYTEYLEIEQKHAKVNLRLQEVYDFCQIIDYNKQTEEIRKLEEKRDILLMEMKETSELIANKENELSAKKEH